MASCLHACMHVTFQVSSAHSSQCWHVQCPMQNLVAALLPGIRGRQNGQMGNAGASTALNHVCHCSCCNSYMRWPTSCRWQANAKHMQGRICLQAYAATAHSSARKGHRVLSAIGAVSGDHSEKAAHRATGNSADSRNITMDICLPSICCHVHAAPYVGCMPPGSG